MALLQPELVKRRAAIAELRSATCNTLTSGACLSSSLEGFVLPSGLQTSAVSTRFRQGLDGVAPQNGMTGRSLQRKTFGLPWARARRCRS